MALALSLIDGQNELPPKTLENSLEQYLSLLEKRRGRRWPNNNYTAYEVRLIEPLLRAGKRQEAIDALQFYLSETRAPAWNQWPEITWLDPLKPTGIGDMPHTWIGAEYALSLRSLFLYEDRQQRQLVLGAGLPLNWLEPKASLQKAATSYGALDFVITKEESTLDRPLLRLQMKLHTPETVSASRPFTIKWFMPPGCSVQNVQPATAKQVPGTGEFILIQERQWDGKVSLACEKKTWAKNGKKGAQKTERRPAARPRSLKNPNSERPL
jgi:hypothetical protein